MRRLLLFLGMLAVAAPTTAATYYVAPSGGADVAPPTGGTIGAPFATVVYAMQHAACGDTIFVRGGTYYASINTQGNAVTSCGDHNNTVTVKAYPGEAPHFYTIAIYAERYLHFEDLYFDGPCCSSPGSTVSIAPGFTPTGTGAGYLRFTNIDIHGPTYTPVTYDKVTSMMATSTAPAPAAV